VSVNSDIIRIMRSRNKQWRDWLKQKYPEEKKFDRAFWQAQGDKAISEAMRVLVVLEGKRKYGEQWQPTLDRSATRLIRLRP
jgi:hypothetical protein